MSQKPQVRSTFKDNFAGPIAASLANTQVVIGATVTGTPNMAYTIPGTAEGLEYAEQIFSGGPLLKAIREKINAGASKIYAYRIGTPEMAQAALDNALAVDTLAVKSSRSSLGNNHYINVQQEISAWTNGHLVAASDAAKEVKIYNSAMELQSTVTLAVEIASVVAVAAPFVKDQLAQAGGFYVLGVDGSANEKIWHYNGDGELVAADTIDISSLIPDGNSASGLETCIDLDDGLFAVTTDKYLLLIDGSTPASPVLEEAVEYEGFAGIASADVSSVACDLNLGTLIEGDSADRHFLALDKTAKKIYKIAIDGSAPELVATVDISTEVDTNPANGISIDMESGSVYVGIHRDGQPLDHLLELTIDWDGDPSPTVTLAETHSVAYGLVGCSVAIDDLTSECTVTIEDRNESPATEVSYSASGALAALTGLVKTAIDDGGVYTTEQLATPAKLLWPTCGIDGLPDADAFVQFASGTDALEPTNADYQAGLDASREKKDAAWIRAVGANTADLWTMVLLHCTYMKEHHESPRFTICEVPVFETTYDLGTPEFRTALQDYCDTTCALTSSIADKNFNCYAGQCRVLDEDGNPYWGMVANVAAGIASNTVVHKSLIREKAPNVSVVDENTPGLWPVFSDDQIEQLLTAKINCMEFREGKGHVVTECLTGAADGSDFADLQILRTQYWATKEAAKSGENEVGNSDDLSGEGRQALKDALRRPLDLAKGVHFDDFELVLKSVGDGDYKYSLGIDHFDTIKRVWIESSVKR